MNTQTFTHWKPAAGRSADLRQPVELLCDDAQDTLDAIDADETVTDLTWLPLDRGYTVVGFRAGRLFRLTLLTR
jgi:hypothetical protein